MSKVASTSLSNLVQAILLLIDLFSCEFLCYCNRERFDFVELKQCPINIRFAVRLMLFWKKEMPVNIDSFWQNPDHARPILTDEMVISAEKQLGVKLPELFITLLKIQNGGYTVEYAFPTNFSAYGSDFIPLFELNGIVFCGLLESPHNILNTTYLITEWALPNDVVILYGDGHWHVCLDYRKSTSSPTVLWLNSDYNQDITIADSFETFINGLILKENFISVDDSH